MNITKAGWVIMGLTLLGAILLQLGQMLVDPSTPPLRTIIGSCLVTTATTLTGLLIRLPKQPWTEEERAEKLKPKEEA